VDRYIINEATGCNIYFLIKGDVKEKVTGKSRGCRVSGYQHELLRPGVQRVHIKTPPRQLRGEVLMDNHINAAFFAGVLIFGSVWMPSRG
jgi:hypothetical protein